MSFAEGARVHQISDVLIVLILTKKKLNMTKCPFRTIPPAALDAPVARFAPAALKSFRHPGGVPIFDSDSEGGVPKFYGDSEGGGVRIFYGHFSRKVPPSP